jgi:hypothetical protein
MTTLDDIKKNWENAPWTISDSETYNQVSMDKIIKARVKKHSLSSFRYFWAALTLQIIVYSLLCHVIVKYWANPEIFYLSIVGIFIYVPFTVVMMKKFKALALVKAEDDIPVSLYEYVYRYHSLIIGFYRFKKLYELALIPVSSIIGVVIVFTLYMPGGVFDHPAGALITLAITLLSCALAIRSENIKDFKIPLTRLEDLLREFKASV